MGERLLRLAEAAAQIGVSEPTMRAWRRTWLPGCPTDDRRGPEPLVIDGVGIRYAESEVQRFIAEAIAAARAGVAG